MGDIQRLDEDSSVVVMRALFAYRRYLHGLAESDVGFNWLRSEGRQALQDEVARINQITDRYLACDDGRFAIVDGDERQEQP
jgi:hypothetical protein